MPLEIVGLGKREVRFVWDEDQEHLWNTRELRLICTCALCVSETTGTRILDPSTVPEDITVTAMNLVGNYGIGVEFSDGHTTSIFRFATLLEQHGIRHGAGATEPFPGSSHT